jgi:hypothetical protein
MLQIAKALERTKLRLGADADQDWARLFYQTANRLAHLDWLRTDLSVEAWLVFVEFFGDEDMGGPLSLEGWEAAGVVTRYAMCLRRSHPLSRYVLHVRPDVRRLGGASAS